MAQYTIFRFQRGEPIVIGREVVSGDPAGFTVEAVLKKTHGQRVPKVNMPVAATFEVQFEAANADHPARWMLIIPAAVSAQLPAGQYATDARFLQGGVVADITDPVFITLAESVSG